jgi:hypothetical protein
VDIPSATLVSYALLAISIALVFVLAKVGVRIVGRLIKKLESGGRLSSELAEFGGALLRGGHLVRRGFLHPDRDLGDLGS